RDVALTATLVLLHVATADGDPFTHVHGIDESQVLMRVQPLCGVAVVLLVEQEQQIVGEHQRVADGPAERGLAEVPGTVVALAERVRAYLCLVDDHLDRTEPLRDLDQLVPCFLLLRQLHEAHPIVLSFPSCRLTQTCSDTLPSSIPVTTPPTISGSNTWTGWTNFTFNQPPVNQAAPKNLVSSSVTRQHCCWPCTIGIDRPAAFAMPRSLWMFLTYSPARENTDACSWVISLRSGSNGVPTRTRGLNVSSNGTDSSYSPVTRSADAVPEVLDRPATAPGTVRRISTPRCLSTDRPSAATAD